MKISLNWLKDYINIDKTPEEISKILTDTGLEVEGLEKIEAVKGGLNGVVVGHVQSVEKHEGADKLNVAQVNVGTEVLQIVCGAPNLKEGQKVPVATVGTTLYPSPEESFKIKKSKIRGVESIGMICAEDEMGIGQSHDGIMVFAEDTEIGLPVQKVLNFEDDYLIEIGLTPNRADGMGHIGVARDLKAFLNVHEGANSSIIYPEINFEEGKNDGVNLKVVNTDMCPRYMGVTIENIKVEPSPEWLQNRLRAIGIGPINNVVDITNYVMHELGNPLHAFDAAVVNGTVEVKTVADKTKFTTLDETERELRNEDLMICNAEKPMCIAGVFGGIDSGVSDKTTSIFLESAYFNPVAVRKTAKAHGLNTDASFRFERGVDPATVACALKRAASMICEIAGGQVSSKIVDSNPDFKIDFDVDFNYENCHRLIGHTIEEDLIDKILKELDIEIVSKSNKDIKLKVPGYRVDVQREADVIEEVLRIYGFNKVPMPEKLNSSLSYSSNIDPEVLQSRISDLLTSNGFNELFNNSLTSSKMETEQGEGFINPEFHVKMLNALSIELDVMRQTMLFSGLQSISHNINRKSADLKMYEFGKTYHKFESGYTENREISLFVTGAQLQESWNATNDKVDFYSLRGALKSILTSLGMTKNIKEASFEELPFEFGTKVKIGKKEVAKLGLVSKKIAKSFGIKQDVYFAQINWDALIELQIMNTTKFKALPKTMPARRDFSLLVNESVKYADIRSIAEQTERKLLRSIGLFDVYEGDKLPEGKKSYAVKFTFQDDENTLKDAQIDAVMNKIQAKLEKELGAELR